MRLKELALSALAVVPLITTGCPGDDGEPMQTTDASTGTTPSTSSSTGEITATSVVDTTVGEESGSSSTGDAPWPEFDCEGVDGVLDGNVLIESVADLAQLEGISEITRSVVINDTDLTDLDAFGCVTQIGGDLQIFGNEQLANVDGLVNLVEIGGSETDDGNLVFTRNPLVPSFDGLQRLTRVRGSFSMNSNDGLTEISGFDSLIGVDGNFTIRDNDALTNIDGLKGLSVVGGVLAITANPMLCLSSVACVGEGITVPAVPPPTWSTAANDPSC
ncbi:MAG: hypothetical protein AB1Z98_13350 [Nannocystaceae bacterium]